MLLCGCSGTGIHALWAGFSFSSIGTGMSYGGNSVLHLLNIIITS